MRIRYTNIGFLIGVQVVPIIEPLRGEQLNQVSIMQDAWLETEDGIFTGFGLMSNYPHDKNADKEIDLSGKSILPTWIDSHTHLVFSHSREQEFVDRISGMSYEEIAKRGGGILNSAKRMQEIDEEQLFDISVEKLEKAIQLGTGAIEIKSGYGLSVDGELKMLRVIKRLKELNRVPIKASFLGAHAYPVNYRENHEGYLSLIEDEMLPIIASEGLADYMDVFCEKGFFSAEETDRLLEAACKYGLKPKIHANQLYNSGGVQVGVKHRAISVDHLETVDEAEIYCLKNSNTIATLLPGAAFFLNMHYQPARKLIDNNVIVSLASDYNPGSCPSANMNFIWSLACTQMRMTPEEGLNACTINAAFAMEMQKELGSIRVGKKASFIITNPIPSMQYLPYSFGENWINEVVIS
jgi:imidazolonepropionase